MHVTLTAYHDSETCTWCERTKCCITVSFSDGFLQSAPLCWRCLQKAVKVRNRQHTGDTTAGAIDPLGMERAKAPVAAARRDPAGP
jgi:hypothetical protein